MERKRKRDGQGRLLFYSHMKVGSNRRTTANGSCRSLGIHDIDIPTSYFSIPLTPVLSGSMCFIAGHSNKYYNRMSHISINDQK